MVKYLTTIEFMCTFECAKERFFNYSTMSVSTELVSGPWNTTIFCVISVADPGFPREEGANPKGGVPTYYLASFFRKLHENEEILGRGARIPRAPP